MTSTVRLTSKASTPYNGAVRLSKVRYPKSSHPWRRASFLAVEAKKAAKEHADRDDAGKQRIIGVYDRMGIRL